MTKTEKKINVKERIDDINIDLSLSDITEIPVKDIAAFKRATVLDLSSNRITTLGKNFGSLTHLTKLDLGKNQIKFLPTDIGKLVNLRHLDLYNNKLEHLPLEMGQLKNLRYLDLKGNPLTPALAKIVGPCLTTKDCQNAAKTIVRFLAEMQVRISEEREKIKLANKQQATADEAADILDEKQDDDSAKVETASTSNSAQEPPSKTRKRERKLKEKKAKLEALSNPTGRNDMQSSDSNSGCCSVLFKLAKLTIFFWLLLLTLMIATILKYPEFYSKHIVELLPSAYQSIFIDFFDFVHETFTQIKRKLL